jgi:aspartyl aminopeptidase
MSDAMNEQQALIADLLDFLQRSPTPFHAVANMVELLQAQGFERLPEAESWRLQAGGRYLVVRNDSSLVAFALGRGDPVATGLHMIGAHTDSPCLRVKPNPELQRNGYLQLGVEVYGGALLSPWFDRDLSLAGRVSYVDEDVKLASALVDFARPVAVIPSLAIHLDRDVNNNRSINAQTQLPPVLMCVPDSGQADFRELLLRQLRQQQPRCRARQILDYEISLYDTQAPAQVGLEREFITGARLDNLLSCYIGLRALLARCAGAGEPTRGALLICSDHEEVGSNSTAGAQGTLLRAVLQRIAGGYDDCVRLIDRSLLVSCDNAHGIHPNFADRHDGNHGPLLNRGPVIKVNANQRYATNSETAALFRHLCQREEVPVQNFVVRSDMGCGSTIGPITATEIGVRTVDIGVPQWAMHSIREMAGSRDCWYLCRALTRFLQ